MDNNLKKGRYTKYTNKIGLFSNSEGGFIKNNTDVVLNFPFKDTVLEAGMSKEDVGRDERFLHQSMDSKDIDTLEEPKVLTNFKYVDKNVEQDLDSTSDIKFFDDKGDLKQNLLIKGNNLLALHTLKQKLASKVKLIYIDPPYNTGNDGFKYNDRFNHSSWLIFMKNRLEEARKLLREDGVIFVQCDDNEQAYLKVLMDEVFGKNNYINNFMWLHGKGKKDKNSRTLQQYAHCYGFNKELLEEWKTEKKQDYSVSNPDNDSRGAWFSGSISFSEERSNQKNKNYFQITSPSGVVWKRQWQCSKEEMENHLKDKKIYFGLAPEYENVPRLKIFPEDVSDVIPENIFSECGTTRGAKKELSALGFNVEKFDTPKPEGLLKEIISISTEEGDVVLDFFLGSGTTSAVAHKMGRRWVGIEQMDYIEDIAKVRLKKVIEGEQGGISKSVEWQGGGDFVYLELKKYNQDYIDRILKSESKTELEDVYKDMAKNAFLKFWFDKKEFEKDEAFRSLSLDERKEILIGILDENQLYLNYADMNDTRYKVTEDEKILTNKFYGEEE